MDESRCTTTPITSRLCAVLSNGLEPALPAVSQPSNHASSQVQRSAALSRNSKQPSTMHTRRSHASTVNRPHRPSPAQVIIYSPVHLSLQPSRSLLGARVGHAAVPPGSPRSAGATRPGPGARSGGEGLLLALARHALKGLARTVTHVLRLHALVAGLHLEVDLQAGNGMGGCESAARSTCRISLGEVARHC